MLKECPNCHGVMSRIRDHQQVCAYCGIVWTPKEKEIIRDVEWARNHYNEMMQREDLPDDLMAIVLLLQFSAQQTVFAHAMLKYKEEEQEKKEDKVKRFRDFFNRKVTKDD